MDRARRRGYGAGMCRAAAIVAFVCLLTGCSGVEAESPTSIWLRQPFLNLGDPQATAEAHCARYGKQAVFQGRLGTTTNNKYVPILAYNCE